MFYGIGKRSTLTKKSGTPHIITITFSTIVIDAVEVTWLQLPTGLISKPIHCQCVNGALLLLLAAGRLMR